MATLSRPAMETGYFFHQLARAHHGVLVIDFESTIAQLGHADHVFPYPTIPELLDCILSTTGTRVIVVSDRRPEDLRPYFLPPGPEIWSGQSFRQRSPLATLSIHSPVAYLAGESRRFSTRMRLRVCPEYHLGRGRPAPAPPQELAQFLLDWLRTCAGDVC